MILNHACPSFAQAVKRDEHPPAQSLAPHAPSPPPTPQYTREVSKNSVPQYIRTLFNAAQQHNIATRHDLIIATRHDLIIATRHATSLLEPRGC